tara:strand:+ start:1495 stop:1626 length:132 start_codon:yes stop_codon:yes gene_type:complete
MDINKETSTLELSASDIILDAMLAGRISKAEAIVLFKAIGFYK